MAAEARLMLAAGQRLRRRAEFAAAARSGRRAGRGVLVVYLTGDGSPERPRTRVGFVVGRTVGYAVARNKVRRRLRHLVRDRLGDLPQGVGVVVRALPGAATRSYGLLGADLDAALAAVTRQPPAASARGPARRPRRPSPEAENQP